MNAGQAIKQLWKELAASNWLVWQAAAAASDRQTELRRTLRKLQRRGHPRAVGAGNTLIIRDLAEFPADRAARIYPVAIHGGFGNDFLRLLNVLQATETGWGVAHAFEAFERYARTVCALILIRDAAFLDLAWRGLRKRTPNRRTRPRSYGGWLIRIQESNPRLQNLWEFCSACLPSVKQSSSHNNRDLILADWLQAIDAFRQAAVHADLLVSRKRWRRLPARVRRYLQFFQGRSTRLGFVLRPDSRKAQEAITTLAECGFLLYRGLCELDGVNPREILRK